MRPVENINKIRIVRNKSFDGVVVITSASHTEGREFEPRLKLIFLLYGLSN